MWRDEFFAIAASSKPPAANSRRHRHGTDCAAIPHPSTKLPPRKTARSDALTIEMSALEARPPGAHLLTHTHTHTHFCEEDGVCEGDGF